MARLYTNRVKPNPRKGEKFSVDHAWRADVPQVRAGARVQRRPAAEGHAAEAGQAARGRGPPRPPRRRRPATPPVGPAPMVGGPPAPPDPRYENEIAGAQRTRDTTVAGVGAARTQGLIGYGYTEGPGGQLTFDPNNAFSKAAQLKRNYDGSRRSTGNRMAASGGLYAGAYQSAQDVVNRGELGAQDELQTSLASSCRGTRPATKARADTRYQEAAGEAESDRVGRIEDNPLYEPTVGYGSPVAAGGRPRAARWHAAAPRGRQARREAGRWPESGRRRSGRSARRWSSKAISKGKPLPAGTLKGSKLTPSQKAAVRGYVKKKGKK